MFISHFPFSNRICWDLQNHQQEFKEAPLNHKSTLVYPAGIISAVSNDLEENIYNIKVVRFPNFHFVNSLQCAILLNKCNKPSSLANCNKEKAFGKTNGNKDGQVTKTQWSALKHFKGSGEAVGEQ